MILLALNYTLCSEMISPTMMMETEVDTDPETQERREEQHLRGGPQQRHLQAEARPHQAGRHLLHLQELLVGGERQQISGIMKKQIKHFTSCGYFFPLYTTCNFKSALFRTVT